MTPNPAEKTHRNLYILDYVLKKSKQTLPEITKPHKGFSDLSRKLGITKSRVRDIFIKELKRFLYENERKLYSWKLKDRKWLNLLSGLIII